MDRPGIESSEFKLTALIMVLGTALDVTGILLEAMKGAALSLPWLPAALVVVGSGIALVKALGYTRSRTMLKLAALQPQTTEVLKVNVPFVKRVAALVKEELQSQPTPPLPTPPV